MQHLVQLDHLDRLTAAMAAHPSATTTPAATTAATSAPATSAPGATAPRRVGSSHPVGAVAAADPGEDGSLVTEYGLLAVVAATVAGVVIQWASGGALVTLFNALLRHARSLVGA
jgi:hypothetical protein